MTYCANCGAPVEGRFCGKCGAPVAAAGPTPAAGPTVPPPGTPPPPGYTPGYAPPPVASSGLAENVASALCYLLTFITGVIFLVLEPYNRSATIRFHAFQAIFFGAGWVVLSIALSILGIIMATAGMGFGLIHLLIFLPLRLLIGLGGFIIWLLLMYKAYNNEKLVLPVIGPMAEQQAAKGVRV